MDEIECLAKQPSVAACRRGMGEPAVPVVVAAANAWTKIADRESTRTSSHASDDVGVTGTSVVATVTSPSRVDMTEEPYDSSTYSGWSEVYRMLRRRRDEEEASRRRLRYALCWCCILLLALASALLYYLMSRMRMCDHPPVALCRATGGSAHLKVVVYDPTDNTCRSYKPGRSCLAGDNRFRDMTSCEAACSGPQRMPACSARVHMHNCVPGVDTNSSQYYRFSEWCLPVDKGSCLVGKGFTSKKECKEACKGEKTDPPECQNNNVDMCNLPAQLYQVAFFRGHCEQRADICPKSAGFTSITHCAKMCQSATVTVPEPTPLRH